MVVIRILLIPLFVKQINAQRGLQMLQPEIKKIQAKYKGKTDPESRQKQQQEMMKLYKDNGTNPLASCLPILLQAPIFFALFHVLNGIGQGRRAASAQGFLTDETAEAGGGRADLRRAASRTSSSAPTRHTSRSSRAVLIVLMSATTFLTQKQLMSKNMPARAMDNPFAQQQKILLYVFPLIFAVSRRELPDRRPALLADHQRLVDGPAVLRDPAQPGRPARRPPRPSSAARPPRRPGTSDGGATAAPAARPPRSTRTRPPARAERPAQQPKRTKKPKGAARPPGAKPSRRRARRRSSPPDAAKS